MSRIEQARQQVMPLAVVALAGVAVQQFRNAQKHKATSERLADLSNRDPLTGLYNRRAFAGTYERLMNSGQHRRAGEAQNAQDVHSMLLLDLDHFGKYNNANGHPAGDAVLKSFADIMLAQTRERDLPVRLGGEEFAILLPHTTQDQAIVVAEKVRQAVAATGQVTVSIGAGEIDPATSYENNYHRIDSLLYSAKEQGRNQVFSHTLEVF